MKMVMIICPQDRQNDVRELITEHGVHAYTEIRNVIGEGETGKKLGTDIWPEKSVLVFTVVSKEKTDSLLKALKDCEERLFPGEGVRAFVLPIEQVI